MDELSNSTNMKANQFYRQWITDYRKEKNDTSGEPIQDGDLLDWIAEKFEIGEFKQLDKPVVMQAEGSDVSEGAAVGNSAAGKGVSVGCSHRDTITERDGYEYCADCGATIAWH